MGIKDKMFPDDPQRQDYKKDPTDAGLIGGKQIAAENLLYRYSYATITGIDPMYRMTGNYKKTLGDSDEDGDTDASDCAEEMGPAW